MKKVVYLFTLIFVVTGCQQNYNEIEAAVIKQCPKGYYLEENRCISKKILETIITHSCPNGYELQGDVCKRTITIQGTTEMRCFDKITPGGNMNCDIVDEQEPIANTNSMCSSGYMLGTNNQYIDNKKCYKLEYYEPIPCPPGYTLMTHQTCVNGNSVVPTFCTKSIGNFVLANPNTKNCEYYNIIEKNNTIVTYSCHPGYTYSETTHKCIMTTKSNGYPHTICPSGYIDIDIGKCQKIETIEKINNYSCQKGTLIDNECVEISYTNIIKSYECPEEYTLNDKKCIKNK